MKAFGIVGCAIATICFVATIAAAAAPNDSGSKDGGARIENSAGDGGKVIEWAADGGKVVGLAADGGK